MTIKHVGAILRPFNQPFGMNKPMDPNEDMSLFEDMVPDDMGAKNKPNNGAPPSGGIPLVLNPTAAKYSEGPFHKDVDMSGGRTRPEIR